MKLSVFPSSPRTSQQSSYKYEITDITIRPNYLWYLHVSIHNFKFLLLISAAWNNLKHFEAYFVKGWSPYYSAQVQAGHQSSLCPSWGLGKWLACTKGSSLQASSKVWCWRWEWSHPRWCNRETYIQIRYTWDSILSSLNVFALFVPINMVKLPSPEWALIYKY